MRNVVGKAGDGQIKGTMNVRWKSGTLSYSPGKWFLSKGMASYTELFGER
jgi:hypothetical protein